MGEPEVESKIRELAELFLAKVQDNSYVRMALSHTGDPARPGVFVCFVSCSDEMALRLKERMEEIVPSEFADAGYEQQKQMIQ